MKRGFSTLSSFTDDGNEPKRTKKKSKTTQRRAKTVIIPAAASDTVADSDNTTPALSAVDVSVYRARFDKQQSKTIAELSSQLSTVMTAIQSGNIDQLVATAVDSFAAAVKRPASIIAADSAVQQSVVAAVYIDNQRRQNRSTNFILSGLPVSDIRPDHQAVVDLCRREFGEAVEVVHCKRLGKPTTGRVQPLLVILKTAAQAVRIIAAARKLRQSTDDITRQSVYIAANLTKAEARAAYEVRCQRRQAAERRRKEQQQPTIQHLPVAPSQFNRHNIAVGEELQVQRQQLPPQSIVSVEVHQPPVSYRPPSSLPPSSLLQSHPVSSSLSNVQLQQPQWWSQQQVIAPAHMSPPPSWQQIQQSQQQPSVHVFQQLQQPAQVQPLQSMQATSSDGLLPAQQILFQQQPMTSSQQQQQSNTYLPVIPSTSQSFNPNASDFLPSSSPSYQTVQPR